MQEAIQVFFDHYLVKWRLDSWTSISLLLKSLSSLRMAACRGETRRKCEKSCSGSADIQHTLSHLACFRHHLGLRPRMIPPRVSHITKHLDFLLQTPEDREEYLFFTKKVTHLIRWCKSICFEQHGFIFRMQPMWLSDWDFAAPQAADEKLGIIPAFSVKSQKTVLSFYFVCLYLFLKCSTPVIIYDISFLNIQNCNNTRFF